MTEKATDLVVIETLTSQIFFEEKGINGVIKTMDARIAAFTPDITTPKGRKEIASFAHKISKDKTAIEKLGKEAGAEAKKITDAIMVKRNFIKKELQLRQDQVRKPLTDWENKEDERLEKHKASINAIVGLGNASPDSELLGDALNRLKSIESSSVKWEEFEDLAKESLVEAVAKIEAAIEVKKKRDADALELANLRKEAEERAEKDRVDAIRKEAEDRVKLEAAEAAKIAADKAEAEKLAVIKEKEDAIKLAEEQKQAAILAEKKADEAKIAAVAKAKADAEAAVEQERQRVEAEKARLEAEEAKREANKNHSAAIRKGVIDALVNEGVDILNAEIILEAICQGLIPNVSISY